MPVTLTFENAGEVTLDLPIKSATSAKMKHGDDMKHGEGMKRGPSSPPPPATPCNSPLQGAT